MTRLAFLLAGVLAWGLPVSAQAPSSASPPAAAGQRHSEEGRPFVRSYAPAEVGGGGQFWATRPGQARRHLRGHGRGRAGVRRRLVAPHPAAPPRRSLARSPSTTPAASTSAAVHDLGYLAPDANGEMQFVSLRDELPADARDVNVIWRTHVANDGVVFQSETGLYRWANDAFTVMRAASRFHRSSLVDGRVYVPVPETGLNVLEHDRCARCPAPSG